MARNGGRTDGRKGTLPRNHISKEEGCGEAGRRRASARALCPSFWPPPGPVCARLSLTRRVANAASAHWASAVVRFYAAFCEASNYLQIGTEAGGENEEAGGRVHNCQEGRERAEIRRGKGIGAAHLHTAQPLHTGWPSTSETYASFL